MDDLLIQGNTVETKRIGITNDAYITSQLKASTFGKMLKTMKNFASDLIRKLE